MRMHPPEIENKVQSVCFAFYKVRKMPAHVRSKILFEISKEIEKESESFTRLIVDEVFKPIKDAKKEVARAVFTFLWASEEAKRIKWETFPIDSDVSGEGRIAVVRSVPKGPCIFITPFNFPLNLVAHKIAPAMAIGTSFLLKPASKAVQTANKLREIAIKSGWPEDAFQIAVCSGDRATALVEDERFKVFSFTGSEQVGWNLQKMAGRKHIGLELGGNAAVAVLEDADEMGGKILTGGNRNGSIIDPTVIENAPHDLEIYKEEVFAPVVVIESFSEWKEVVQRINDSRFGLQAGIFTNNLSNVMDSFDEIETGGIIINDVPSFRFDPMPFGGMKNSGIGRVGGLYV